MEAPKLELETYGYADQASSSRESALGCLVRCLGLTEQPVLDCWVGRECTLFSPTSQLRGDMACLGFGVVQPNVLFFARNTADRRQETGE